jgi:arylsulfatase A-like enzyme
MRRRVALVVALGLIVACGRDALPPKITTEQVVSELAPPLTAGASVAGVPAGEVRRAVLQPGYRAGCGAPHDALVTPPGAAVRFRVDVPPDGALRFSVGVDGDKENHPEQSGVDFRVTVNGAEAFARAVNPAARRRDRCWVDGAIDLRAHAGQTVDLVLEARADRAAHPLAGTAGWSRVRLVRQEHHERQVAGGGPNVILMLVDTTRADQLGIYGASPSPSPMLDAFAARGLVFDLAVAQASWTMPAVASIFSGLHPRSHGAVGADVDEGSGQSGNGTLLPDAVVTIAETAEGAGVTTFGVSTNLLVSSASNMAQGFETFLELPFDQKTRDYAPAAVVNARFLDWLRRERQFRFFAYLHYMEPHGPYSPPQRLRPAPPAGMRGDLAAGWIQDYGRAVNEGRAAPPSPAEVAYLRQLYDGDIRSWDEQFGALIDELEHAGVLDRTIVIVMADHGEEFLEHGNLEHGGHLYDETVHIPLVMVGPGIHSGRRTDAAQGIDLLPTIAGLLGASAPPGLSGRDLLATSSAGDIVSEIVSGFGDDGAGRGTVALRSGRWKLIRPGGSGALELYDLATDPGEHTNLAATSPEVAALETRLDRWASGAPAPPQTAARDPGLHEKLRQLGYVQ